MTDTTLKEWRDKVKLVIMQMCLKAEAEVKKWRDKTELVIVQMCLKAKEEIKIESAVRSFTDLEKLWQKLW